MARRGPIVAIALSVAASCGARSELDEGKLDTFGGDGAPADPAETFREDCVKVCGLEDAFPSCVAANSCDGGCPDSCVEGCLGFPSASESYCAWTYMQAVHCFANAVPFLGCDSTGRVLGNHCEPQGAELEYCLGHIPH